MKQEAQKKNNKKLLLIIGLAVLLVVVGVLLAVLFWPAQGDDGDTSVNATLYWNIDRVKYTENAEVEGLSTREKGDDGLYHILLAVDGKQVDYTCADKQLVNYLDTMQVFGLILGEDGSIIEVVDPTTLYTEAANNYYVQKIDGNTVTVNSSYAMNGMEMKLELTDSCGVYNVDPSAEVVGAERELDIMDCVLVYSDAEGSPAYVYVTEVAPVADIYWRVERCYDSETATTTRVPDENGVYTILMSCNGELVEVKCRDIALVNKIDASAILNGVFALQFDEEGYLCNIVNIQLAIRGKELCRDFVVTAIDGDQITLTKYSAGAEQGKVVTVTMNDDCKIYQCCRYGCFEEHCGEIVDSLRLYDRVYLYTDLENNPIMAFVAVRLVDSPMYYNLTRKYTSADGGSTTREPDANGYYVFDMLADGEPVTLRTKDKAIATAIDFPYDNCVGLDVNGDIITRVYEAECVSGYYSPGYRRYVTSITANIITLTKPNEPETFANCTVADDCKIYDVTGNPGVKKGTVTTLQLGDRVIAWYDYKNEVSYIFVTDREVEVWDYCDYCQKKVKWDVLSTSGFGTQDSGEHLHYVIGSDLELTWGLGVLNNGTTLCLNMYGSSITHVSRFFVAGGSTLNIMGGGSIISTGTHTNASLNTGNITVSSGTLNLYDTTLKSTNPDMPAVALTGKDAVVNLNGGSVVGGVDINYGVANLGGKATVLGAKKELSNNIYVGTAGRLNVKADWTGTASMKVAVLTAAGISKTYGTSEGAFTGKLYYESKGNPAVIGQDGGLVVQGEIIPDENDPDYRYCEHCGTKVMWSPAPVSGHSEIKSGEHIHFYLTEDFTKAWGYMSLTNGTQICLDLNGYTIDQTGRIFVADGTLNIMGEGAVTTSTHRNTSLNTGAVTTSNGTVNIYGGTYKSTSAVAPAIAVTGAKGVINMYGGTVVDGATISAGVLNLGGTAKIIGANGETTGNIYVGSNGRLNVAADWTGSASAKFEYLSGGTSISIVNGTSEGDYAGKLYYEGKGYPQIFAKDGGLYIDGEVLPDENDPNYRYCEHCGEKVMWVALTKAMGDLSTGEHYHYYLLNDVSVGQWSFGSATNGTKVCLDLDGHNITGGRRISVGGTDSELNIMGIGTVTCDGTSEKQQYVTGTITVLNGEANLYGGTYVSTAANGTPAVQVSNGTLTLKGSASAGSIVVGSSAKLAVDPGFTGTANVKFSSVLENPVPNTVTTGSFSGKLTTTIDGKDYTVVAQDGKLFIEDYEPSGIVDTTISFPSGVANDTTCDTYCPVCEKVVTWTSASSGLSTRSTGTHLHLFTCITRDQDDPLNYNMGTVNNGTTICLYLNGTTTVHTGRLVVNGGATVNIMGSGSIITTGTSSGATTGGVSVYNGTLNVYGDVTLGSTNDAVPGLALVDSANAAVNLSENAKVSGGVNLTIGTLTLADAATVVNNNAATDIIYVADAAKLAIGEGWTGSANVVFESITSNPVPNGECTGTYTGTLTTTIDGTQYNVIAQDGKLYIDGYTIPDDGTGDDDGSEDDDDTTDEGLLVLDDDGYGYCEACGTDVLWSAAATGGLSTKNDGTHYHLYLTQDFEKSWGYLTLSNSTEMCLHLNGYSINQNSRIFVANASKLNIMGSGTVTSSGTHSTAAYNSGCITVDVGTVNIYGGTIVSTSADAPAITLQNAECYVNLYAGTVQGGIKVENGAVALSKGVVVDSITVSESGALNVGGDWTGTAVVTFASALVDGMVPVANGVSGGEFTGTLTMADGTVLVGQNGRLVVKQADSDDEEENEDEGLLVLDDEGNGYCEHCDDTVQWTELTGSVGTLTSGTHHYYLTKDWDSGYTMFELNTSAKMCLHLNGHTLTFGRRIRTYSATTLSIMGAGSITGTNANPYDQQATIHVGWKSTVNIYGGSYASTANGVPTFLVNSSSATLNLYSAEVTDGITLTNGTVNLSGDTTVDSISVASGKLSVDAGWTGSACASFSTLTDTYEIPEANGTSGGVYTGTLTLDTDGYAIVGSEGRLVVSLDATAQEIIRAKAVSKAANAMDFTESTTQTCPVCGESVTWTAITASMTDVNMSSGSHYYLAEDVTVTSTDTTAYITGVGCLHLNGKNLTVTNTRAIMPNGKTLNVMGNGTVAGYIASTAGAAIHLNSKNAAAAVNLYGGTYKKYNDDARSSVIWVGTNGGTVNMYDGVTVDASGKTNLYYTPGIAVYGNIDTTGNGGKATFNMYGGTVIGGTVKESNTQGCSVTVGYYHSSSSLYGDAVFNMYAGTIQNGSTGRYGGNVNIADNGVFNMYGGTVKDGTANYNTTGESTTASYGGNIALMKASSVANLYGGTVSGGTALTRGGNIYVNAGTLTLSGDATVSGGSSALGNNIGISGNGKLNILNDWTGTASVEYTTGYSAGDEIAQTSAQCGSVDSGSFVAGGSYDGTLTYELDEAQVVWGVDGKLCINADHNADGVVAILGIGNSFAVDSLTMLYDVYKAEYPDKTVVIGILNYSGCTLQQHVSFLSNNSAVYYYHKLDSSIYASNNGKIQVISDTTMQTALKDVQWDIVSLQQHSGNTPNFDTYNSDIGTIRDYVTANLGYEPEFAWNFTWAYPDDAELLSTNANANFASTFFANYGTSANMYGQIRDAVVDKIVNGEYTWEYVMPVGTVIENVRQSLTAKDLYRDSLHLNNLGRFVASYTWYCELEGYDGVDKALTELKLKEVPSILALTSGVTEITDELEQIIVDAVNDAMANKYAVTAE